jgi:DNA-binding NtrC family response regulator
VAENPGDSPSNVEAAMIRNALAQARGDRGLATRLLGITESELESRMRASGLTLDDSPGQ